MTATVRNVFRDPFKKLLFELGAGYYARKLATGPEADIRREFVQSLQLPPSGNGHGTLRVLDVGCGPGHVARELAHDEIPENYPFLSIIVPAYNEAEVIASSLSSLLELKYPGERSKWARRRFQADWSGFMRLANRKAAC